LNFNLFPGWWYMAPYSHHADSSREPSYTQPRDHEGNHRYPAVLLNCGID
jgi:hypothetical protein